MDKNIPSNQKSSDLYLWISLNFIRYSLRNGCHPPPPPAPPPPYAAPTCRQIMLLWVNDVLIITSFAHHIPINNHHDDVIKWNIFRVTGPLCGEFTGPGEFPAQRPVTRSFNVFFDLCLNKRLSKQWWGWGFGTQSCSLWRQSNV